MLQSIMEQLNQANPQLAQQIISNPDEFMNLLAEEDDGDAPIPPGASTVAVTQEERDAIERVSCFSCPEKC
jgi:UV excision repair protein RAD23